MSLSIPLSLLLTLGVLFIAIGVNDQTRLKIFFNVAGAALIVVWANLAGLES